MALLNPIDKPALQRALVGQMKTKINSQFDLLNRAWTDMFNLIWNNPTLSPQEALDAFGTDAAALFQLSAATQSFINSQNPGINDLTPPVPFTINQDGTVKVG